MNGYHSCLTLSSTEAGVRRHPIVIARGKAPKQSQQAQEGLLRFIRNDIGALTVAALSKDLEFR